uniref:Amine oxidase domain-containing protein n=1 Tax=Entomoneis paludosa TaxID=265537 RepID=A0A7S2YTX9_9STRA
MPLLGDPDALTGEIARLLPPPLDVALLTEFDETSSLTSTDRATGLGLLGAWADFEQENRESWLRYDSISAENLFRRVAAVSPNLYEEIVSPLLHVLPMTPGYDCSAAAALSCFHVFALQSRGAFDVRWCRGSISEKIFNPWAEKLKASGNVDIRGGSKVTAIEESTSGTKQFIVTVNDEEKIACDAVVMAIGATTAGRLIDCCPPLQSISNLSAQWKDLRGVTCVAVRLFMDSTAGNLVSGAMVDSPVVVCGPKIGGAPSLVETGFCIYDLTRLQDEFKDFKEEDGICTFEIDFFRADDLADKDNEEILNISLQAITDALCIKSVDILGSSAILDSSVVRARNAVSHFCVGSAKLSPPVRLKKGMYMCGDWVDRTGHSSWSTEKAVVTGRQAAKAFGTDFALSCQDTEVIPAPDDTRELALLRQVASIIRRIIPEGLPPAPWAIASRLFSSGGG